MLLLCRESWEINLKKIKLWPCPVSGSFEYATIFFAHSKISTSTSGVSKPFATVRPLRKRCYNLLIKFILHLNDSIPRNAGALLNHMNLLYSLQSYLLFNYVLKIRIKDAQETCQILNWKKHCKVQIKIQACFSVFFG